MSTRAQGVTPPPAYFRNIEIADSLSGQNNYKAATQYYSTAIKAFGGRALPDDRYNAARAWAFAGRKDSAIAILQRLATKQRYWNYQRFIDDPAFSFLKHTHSFDDLVGWFKANKQKYYAEINVEFYNALDSIHTANLDLQKKSLMATMGNGNSLMINKQRQKKDSVDLQRVTRLLDKYGWPDSAAVGFYGNYTLFALIKQSPRKGYEKYRNMMNMASLRTNPSLNLSLVATLDTIMIDDQQDRKHMNTVRQMYGMKSKQWDSLITRMSYYDSVNLVKVKQIIDTYGWPGSDIAGFEGATAVFLVIQHSDHGTQEKYLPLMREAVKKGKARASDLALLEDRVLIGNGKPQIYGSQLQENHTTGKYEFAPIEDEANVNKRRAAVGLQPLEDYAKMMGVNYTPVK